MAQDPAKPKFSADFKEKLKVSIQRGTDSLEQKEKELEIVVQSDERAVLKPVCSASSTKLDDALILLSKEGRILEVNERCCHMFQRLRRELEGGSFEILIPTNAAEAHQAHLTEWFEGSHKEKHENRLKKVCPSGAKGIKKDGTEFSIALSFKVFQKSLFKKKKKEGRIRVQITELQETDVCRATVVTDETPFDAKGRHASQGGSPIVGPMAEGPTITSRYETEFEEIEALGSGNFGSVMKCRNRLDKEFYAVKQVHFKFEEAEEERKNKLKEIGMMARLGSHPNIVRYYSSWVETLRKSALTSKLDSDSDDDYWVHDQDQDDEDEPIPVMFIQMELSEGKSLESWLANPERVLNEAQSMYLFIQIVDAVSFIHESGLIHRDIKPANILLEEVSQSRRHTRTRTRTSNPMLKDIFASREVSEKWVQYTCKLADFGLATVDQFDSEEPERETISQNVLLSNPPSRGRRMTCGIGTKLYGAPEQLRTGLIGNQWRNMSLGSVSSPSQRGVYDDKVDIYALGFILVELFTPTFRSHVELYLFLQKLRDGILPEAFVRDFPELAKLAQSMLDLNPDKRPCAAEVLQMIQIRVMGDSMSSTDSDNTDGRKSKWGSLGGIQEEQRDDELASLRSQVAQLKAQLKAASSSSSSEGELHTSLDQTSHFVNLNSGSAVRP